MLKKTELMQLSEGLSRLYTGLETDLIANIAEYLKKGNINTSTAQWKIQMLSSLGALDKANIKTIAEYAQLSPDILIDTLETASLTAIGELEPGFQALAKQGIIEGTDVPVEKTMARSLKTYNKQAVNSLNMVNTVMRYKAKQTAQKAINDTAELAEKQSFLDMLNKAAGKAVTGQDSRQAAMRQCIKEMSDKGIPAFVDKSGREWSPEAYINMDIRTTSSNVAHQSQFDRMNDYGIDLIQTSSHAGARPKCAKDQGKIFNRNGSGGETTDLHGNKIRYYAWKDSSYGEPDGILGINCGHHIYPFVPGVSIQRYFPYDEEENDKLYKQIQQQRELERRVRKSKRECMALDTLGDTEGLEKASVTLKQRQQALKQYCADNGLSYKADRTAVVGYNKSLSAKVNAVNKAKDVDKSGESGIIKTTKNSRNNAVPSAEHYFEKIGDLDISDTKAVAKSFEEFENKYRNSEVEHCRVITAFGEIFEVHGDKWTVDTSLLGEKMSGSINEHNHVTGQSQYSFSWEDLISSVNDGSKISMAFDEKYWYTMILPNKSIDTDILYEAYRKAETEVDEINFNSFSAGKGKAISDDDYQHEVVCRACEMVGIKYDRKKKA